MNSHFTIRPVQRVAIIVCMYSKHEITKPNKLYTVMWHFLVLPFYIISDIYWFTFSQYSKQSNLMQYTSSRQSAKGRYWMLATLHVTRLCKLTPSSPTTVPTYTHTYCSYLFIFSIFILRVTVVLFPCESKHVRVYTIKEVKQFTYTLASFLACVLLSKLLILRVIHGDMNYLQVPWIAQSV
jgi:hypothetical protein